MSYSRRTFVKTGVAATLAALGARPLMAQIDAHLEPIPPIEDPRLKELTARALDAAQAAGAMYADVRLTHTRERPITNLGINDHEEMSVGVRALVSGYWGFASSSVWSPDEMARLGREAVFQAKINAGAKPRQIDLAPAPVENGHWVMPVEYDPFEISPIEIQDYLNALILYVHRNPGIGAQVSNLFYPVIQERVLNTTEGTYCSQRLYRSHGVFGFSLRHNDRVGSGAIDGLSYASVGWELFRKANMRDRIDQKIEQIKFDLSLPVSPVEVGRYDAVLSASATAALASATLGVATELDRALGYEANAGGTSYLNDPLAMLGTYQLGNSLLNVTATRSEPGGAGMVRWDDEGVQPKPFALIRSGIVTDFQTTREGTGWLKDVYTTVNRPLASHGCAQASLGMEVPLTHTADLIVEAGAEDRDFDTLCATVKDGVAIQHVDRFNMDFQQLNGLSIGVKAYEIKNGKRAALLGNSGFLFRAPELWKSLVAIGGKASAERRGFELTKGEPQQSAYHSVTSVPMMFKEMTIIDILRRS